MITIILLTAWFFSVIFILRFFHVSCKPLDNPYDLLQDDEEEEEEWEIEECHRCGAENILTPDTLSWEHEEFYVHEWHDAVFCEGCFYDKDKSGQPYLSDLDEMRANPYNYLPRGY